MLEGSLTNVTVELTDRTAFRNPPTPKDLEHNISKVSDRKTISY